MIVQGKKWVSDWLRLPISDSGHQGPCNPYKPWNYNLYTGFIAFSHKDNTQNTINLNPTAHRPSAGLKGFYFWHAIWNQAWPFGGDRATEKFDINALLIPSNAVDVLCFIHDIGDSSAIIYFCSWRSSGKKWCSGLAAMQQSCNKTSSNNRGIWSLIAIKHRRTSPPTEGRTRRVPFRLCRVDPPSGSTDRTQGVVCGVVGLDCADGLEWEI